MPARFIIRFIIKHVYVGGISTHNTIRRTWRRRLGEIDVVSEAGLAGTLEQSKQRQALVSAGSAPDDNDDAMMWFHRCEV
jgi:hypothetical protein